MAETSKPSALCNCGAIPEPHIHLGSGSEVSGDQPRSSLVARLRDACACQTHAALMMSEAADVIEDQTVEIEQLRTPPKPPGSSENPQRFTMLCGVGPDLPRMVPREDGGWLDSGSYDCMRAERDTLRAALSISRGQWIHSAHAAQCLAALGEAPASEEKNDG